MVSSERDGQAQKYSLNPQPLGEIRDGWLASFARMQVESLKALRKRVEADKRRSR